MNVILGTKKSHKKTTPLVILGLMILGLHVEGKLILIATMSKSPGLHIPTIRRRSEFGKVFLAIGLACIDSEVLRIFENQCNRQCR